MIAYENLRMDGYFNSVRVLDYRLSVMAGGHAEGFVSAMVRPADCSMERIQEAWGQKVRIYLENDPEKPLFHGMVRRAAIAGYGNDTELSLELVSATILLDQEQKSRSFQDGNGTYREIVKSILKDYNKAHVIWGCDGEKKVEGPFVQYQETDWEFISRLASHFHTGLIPEVHTGNANFWLGPGFQGEDRECTGGGYRFRMDDSYFREGGSGEGLKRQEFLYYEIESTDRFDLGDRMVIEGYRQMLLSYACKMTEGKLLFCYHFGMEGLLGKKKRYPEKLKGVSLKGTIIETKGELVRLHLDIDPMQKLESAWAFQWLPRSGNMFYCMPEVGTKAVLYFGDREEKRAGVVWCYRENGEGNSEFQDTTRRYFTTPYHKRLTFFPEEIGLAADESGQLMARLKDSEGIMLRSPSRVDVTAKRGVFLSAEKVQVQAPKQISLIRNGRGGLSLINVCNRFDLYGKSMKLESMDRRSNGQTGDAEGMGLLGQTAAAVLSHIPTGGKGPARTAVTVIASIPAAIAGG